MKNLMNAPIKRTTESWPTRRPWVKVKPVDMTPVEKDAFNSVLETRGNFQILSCMALHLSALDGAILPDHSSPPEQMRIEV